VALDVYVGTLTRLYSGDWENTGQRWARENGVQYNTIYAGGQPEPPPGDEIRKAVADWQRYLSDALQPHGAGPAQWDEGDQMPYFSERPSYTGYGALVVWAAHMEHPDLPMPAETPDSWTDDLAYQRSTAEGFNSRYKTLLLAEQWLPLEFPFVFEAPMPVAEKGRIGSVFTLKRQLDELHETSAPRFAELKQSAPFAQAPTSAKQGLVGRLLGRKPPPVETRQQRPNLPKLRNLAYPSSAIWRRKPVSTGCRWCWIANWSRALGRSSILKHAGRRPRVK
jgi:hypothetical protein